MKDVNTEIFELQKKILASQVLVLSDILHRKALKKGVNRPGGDYENEAAQLIQSRESIILEHFGYKP